LEGADCISNGDSAVKVADQLKAASKKKEEQEFKRSSVASQLDQAKRDAAESTETFRRYQQDADEAARQYERVLAEEMKAKAAKDEIAARVLASMSAHECRQKELDMLKEHATSAKKECEKARRQEREVALTFGSLQYKEDILKRHQEICENARNGNPCALCAYDLRDLPRPEDAAQYRNPNWLPRCGHGVVSLSCVFWF